MKVELKTIQSYLTATLENAQDHASEPAQLMHMVEQMDQIFHREIFDHDIKINAVSGFLAMNAYMILLSAVRQALTGHVVTVFPVVRSALESACYAYLIAKDEAKHEIWLKRHQSDSALKKCRNTFTVKNTINELKSLSPEMAEYVMALYDASIDFGAHPNQKSVVNHITDLGHKGDSFHGFELTGVYGRNSWEVNHALLVCVETGQAIVFLIAASAEDHPLLNDRLHIFQNWLDEKNRVIEDINGGPIDYTGPMYSSLIPPK